MVLMPFRFGMGSKSTPPICSPANGHYANRIFDSACFCEFKIILKETNSLKSSSTVSTP